MPQGDYHLFFSWRRSHWRSIVAVRRYDIGERAQVGVSWVRKRDSGCAQLSTTPLRFSIARKLQRRRTPTQVWEIGASPIQAASLYYPSASKSLKTRYENSLLFCNARVHSLILLGDALRLPLGAAGLAHRDRIRRSSDGQSSINRAARFI